MGQQSPPDLFLVLVVDDDEDVLQMTADILETLGYRVLKAKTGLEGRTVGNATPKSQFCSPILECPI
jgi:CheY-like chemotaxis protein